MALPPDTPKRPIGPPPPLGTNRPAGPPMPNRPIGPNSAAGHHKKPMPYGKKPPIKGAIKRPGPPPSSPPPHGGQPAPTIGYPSKQPPINPNAAETPPPIKAPIPPPPRPISGLSTPPPIKSPPNIPEKKPETAAAPASPFKVSKEPPSLNSKEETEFFTDANEKGRYDNNFAADLNLPPVVLKTKVMLIVFIIIFASGLFAGRYFGQSSGTVVSQGLQGVIENPEVPRGRLRCGIAEKGQGCILYLVNPERREIEARDFYALASQLTGVQEFLIQTGNMRYANTRIRPGHFAQINIPPIQ